MNPFISISCLGVAYSLLASALWPIAALIIPEYQLGTAYGLMQVSSVPFATFKSQFFSFYLTDFNLSAAYVYMLSSEFCYGYRDREVFYPFLRFKLIWSSNMT